MSTRPWVAEAEMAINVGPEVGLNLLRQSFAPWLVFLLTRITQSKLCVLANVCGDR